LFFGCLCSAALPGIVQCGDHLFLVCWVFSPVDALVKLLDPALGIVVGDGFEVAISHDVDIGLLAYFGIPLVGNILCVLSGARLGRWYWMGLQLGVTAGTVFVGWLWYQALFVIHILCLYCMIVWAVMIPMVILLTVRNLLHGVIPAPVRVVHWAQEWAWPVVGIVYVAVAGSVLVTFFTALTGY